MKISNRPEGCVAFIVLGDCTMMVILLFLFLFSWSVTVLSMRDVPFSYIRVCTPCATSSEVYRSFYRYIPLYIESIFVSAMEHVEKCLSSEPIVFPRHSNQARVGFVRCAYFGNAWSIFYFYYFIFRRVWFIWYLFFCCFIQQRYRWVKWYNKNTIFVDIVSYVMLCSDSMILYT